MNNPVNQVKTIYIHLYHKHEKEKKKLFQNMGTLFLMAGHCPSANEKLEMPLASGNPEDIDHECLLCIGTKHCRIG